MPAPIEFHTRDDVDLSGALVVVGAPGLGFVGSIMTRYLVETLQMERVGGLHSAEFPPYVPVENGRPLHPVRIHSLETKCGLDLQCDRIAVLTSEFFTGPRMIHHLSSTLMDWADEIDAALILVPDAIVSENEEESDRVQGIASTDAAADVMARAGVAPLADGAMTGMTAGLMAAGEHRGRDVLALLAESNPEHPDARGAARLVEVVDLILPGIKIESGPLLKRAEEIEATVRSVRQQLAQQSRRSEEAQPADPAHMSIYR